MGISIIEIEAISGYRSCLLSGVSFEENGIALASHAHKYPFTLKQLFKCCITLSILLL